MKRHQTTEKYCRSFKYYAVRRAIKTKIDPYNYYEILFLLRQILFARMENISLLEAEIDEQHHRRGSKE